MAMTIEWMGDASVLIKGPGDRCFINPEEKDLGKKKLTNKGGISLIGYRMQEYAGTYQDPHLIATPGEYDIGGFFVVALRSEDAEGASPNLFIIRYERRTIAFIDEYREKEMSNADLEAVGSVDILILPLDEGVKEPRMDVEKAVRITNQIDPRVVLPIERSGAKNAVSAFLKEMGEESHPSEAFTLKQNEALEAEETEVVVLKPSSSE